MNKELKIIAVSFSVMVVGGGMVEVGFESTGKFLATVGILTGITFISIGGVKYWFGDGSKKK
ncbi:hypothetical protein PRZ61_19305 [Halomonas pacifica]|uniref:Uncharacterized protein n=1 Tax=Bisbaumannia pacifica TaxID=77098 RepID=A0A510XCX2_9GAMM|nr:hypothetical protein [Halomonas pacifica]MDC8805602.1 hypothetical protein [Halomonas pacifica]GEK49276.1 hypothetical protein HPA02_35590 [Halomonas pacifica]